MMKRWPTVAFSTLILCFGFGVWRGVHHDQLDNPSRPARWSITLLAPENLISESGAKALRKRHQIQLNVLTYKNSIDLEKLLQTVPHDLIIFSSLYFNELRRKEIFFPLETTHLSNIDNISPDLRRPHWDKTESFAIPLAWQAFVTLKKSASSTIKVSPHLSLRNLQKSAKLSLVGTPEILSWATENLDSPNLEELRWFDSGEEIRSLESSDFLLLEWSRYQLLKNELNAETWYPEEKLPFIVYFAALSKKTSSLKKSEESLNLLYARDVYEKLWTTGRVGFIMESTQPATTLYSSLHFRNLPLSEYKPYPFKEPDAE